MMLPMCAFKERLSNRARLSVRLASILTVLAFLAPQAAAQLDLPSKLRDKPSESSKGKSPEVELRRGSAGSVAPHIVCSDCGERNYTAPAGDALAGGVQRVWCAACRGNRPHVAPKKAAVLSLPSESKSSERNRAVTGSPTGIPAGSNASVGADPNLERPAESFSPEVLQIWEGVALAKSADDPVALRAVPTVLAFGESGLISARGALDSANGSSVLTAARVLLRGGDAADADRVVERLRKRMPGNTGADLLGELIALDPVRATPRLFCELLDHTQYPVRAAADRALRSRLDEDVVPLLAPVLTSSRGDARYRAVDLMSRLDDPATTEPFLSRLGDTRAKVAWRACEALARSQDEIIESRLMAIAFGDRWILREAAYAILAIVEREDYRLEPILSGDQVPALLRGLASSDPFVSGACAAGLAGIGFRSPRSSDSPWLDREVPEELLSTAVGDRFFDDYSSLQAPALRRLKQITGVSFGSEGPLWARWWVENAAQFRASRAVLSVEDGQEVDLEVRFRGGGSDARAFVLLGPERAEPKDLAGEVFYLHQDGARDLVALFRREGILGADRLPGVRGGQIQRGRNLEIRVGKQAKTFAFGPGVSEPWFERAVQMLDALVERNLWQRYPHPADHMGSRRALWEKERDWWREARDDVGRAIGVKGLILGRLADLDSLDREADLDELDRLYREPHVAETSDFTPLLSLLLEERFYSSMARKLVALARRAGGLEAGEELDPERQNLAAQLIGVLHDQYEANAAGAIGDLLRLRGPAAIRDAAADERPLIRGIAATALATSKEAADRGLLLALLADPEPAVEIAAVLAAGHARVEETEVELLLRARGTDPDTKKAALLALGHFGGEHALEAIVAGLADADTEVRIAAAQGLAELSDPSAASLLVSLLRQGSDSDVFDYARQGLLRLGEAAWDDLFNALRSTSPESRREAALLLAYQSCPDAASPLIRILTENPEDVVVANELTVLSCVDNRRELDPADAWWRWWDDVRHDDAFAWFQAAVETRKIQAPDPSAFLDGGTEEGIAFLVRVMGLEEPWLAERARRELIRMAGRDIGGIPPAGVERDVWLGTLYEVLTEARD